MNQVINEAYENYISVKEDYHNRLINNSVSDIQPLELLSIDKFIDKIKIDSDFSDRWKLKITERELSLEERDKLAVGTVTFLLGSKKKDSYDEVGIPTKLIIITYNNKIIESYE